VEESFGMSDAAQIEMFDARPRVKDPNWKVHRSAGSAGEVRYHCPDAKLIIYEGLDGETGQATWQPSDGGRWFSKIGQEKIKVRDAKCQKKTAVLSQIARTIRDINRAREIQRLALELERSAAERSERLHGGSSGRTRTRNTLCMEPEPMTYEARRIIPSEVLREIGAEKREPHFVIIPNWLGEREEPSLFEKFAYSRLALRAGKSGTFALSLMEIAKLSNTSTTQAEKIVRSLRNRNLIREIYRGKRGVITYEFLWHPWMSAPPTPQLSWVENPRGSRGCTQLSGVEPPNSVGATTQLSSGFTHARAEEGTKKRVDVSPCEPRSDQTEEMEDLRASGWGKNR